jgi:uncharacterized protein YcbX
MHGRIASIHRHPVKGFTPERLDCVELAPAQPFPGDRLFAVENGPSGFDPENPAFVPKQKFTVLASIPDVARARTAYDEATGVLSARAEGLPAFREDLSEPAGREAFAAWLTTLLGDEVRGALRVLPGPGQHRFTDHPQGQVSIVNLESVRDFERRLGRPVDPLRFRANLYVEGWPAWAELDWTDRDLALGAVRARVFKPIVRCAATHVNPATAERDIDLVPALFDNYGHMHLGIYVHVTQAGRIATGDPCEGPAP